MKFDFNQFGRIEIFHNPLSKYMLHKLITQKEELGVKEFSIKGKEIQDLPSFLDEKDISIIHRVIDGQTIGKVWKSTVEVTRHPIDENSKSCYIEKEFHFHQIDPDKYYESIVDAIDVDSEEKDLKNLEIESWYIDKKGYYLKLLSYGKNTDKYYKRVEGKPNPHRFPIKVESYSIRIWKENEKGEYLELNITPEKWVELDPLQLDDLNEHKSRIEKTVSSESLQGMEQAKNLLEKGVSDSTDLVMYDSVSKVEQGVAETKYQVEEARKYHRGLSRAMREKRREVDAKIQHQLDKVEALKKQALQMQEDAMKKANLMKEELNRMVVLMKNRIGYLNRMVSAIKLFVGEDTNIIQIREGKPAPTNTPIHLRQLQLYIDEEFAVMDDSWTQHNDIGSKSNLEKFDKWLVESGRYKQVVPEERCVVLMRPRRKGKKGRYSLLLAEFFPNQRADLQLEDYQAYFLFRDGDNLYRVMSSEIEAQNKMFPSIEELQELYNRKQSLGGDIDIEDVSDRYISSERNKVEDLLFKYQRVNLLISGVIDKGGIFNMPQGFRFTDFNKRGELVKYIYDADSIIDSGKPSFEEWKEQLNQDSIKKGSRILFIKPNGGCGDWENRYPDIYYHKHSLPSLPKTGFYNVEVKKRPYNDYPTKRISIDEYIVDKRNQRLNTSITEKEILENSVKITDRSAPMILKEVNDLVIKYYPIDNWYDRKAKKRISFTIEETDSFVLAFDSIKEEDIDYYLTNRVGRKEYQESMPLLVTLKRLIIEERKQEKIFSESIASRIALETKEDIEKVLKIVEDAVYWWKNVKVTVWKRAISKDESKAWRMIEKRVKSKLKSKK